MRPNTGLGVVVDARRGCGEPWLRSVVGASAGSVGNDLEQVAERPFAPPVCGGLGAGLLLVRLGPVVVGALLARAFACLRLLVVLARLVLLLLVVRVRLCAQLVGRWPCR